MGEVQDENKNAHWLKSWENNKPSWHNGTVHKSLEKYLDKIIDGRESCRICFPLCGKAVDMKWLADMGHTVVGIELSEIAIRDFFKEQNVEYDVSPVQDVEGAELYQSKDGKLRLYKGDLFKMTSDIIGKFDAIWDRGSLVAITKEDRERYSDLMVSYMTPECKYLLSTFEYDPTVMPGPPRNVPDAAVRRLFSDRLNIDILDTSDTLSERWQARGHKWMSITTTLLTLK